MKGVIFVFVVSSCLILIKGRFIYVCNIKINNNYDDLLKCFNYVLLFIGLKFIFIFLKVNYDD